MYMKRVGVLVIIITLLGGYAFWAISADGPVIQPAVSAYTLQVQTPPPDVTWPAKAQAAVALAGMKGVQVHGEQKAMPIASAAKMITALCILKAKPLALGEQGPVITITQADLDIYRQYIAVNGSVLPVRIGQQLTEYQMIQAIMLPSANNVADSMAIWAFGSLENYRAYATEYLKSLGLKNTTIGIDASGLSPTTTSTAADLVMLGKAVMKNPVLAQIAGQASAPNIPGVGTITNVNSLLGSHGIVGIKTGNTNQAGGVFVGAAQVVEKGRTETIITAIVGAANLQDALNQSVPLIESARTNFKPVTLINRGSVVGSYKLPWSNTAVPASTAGNLVATAWKGSPIPARISLSPIRANSASGTPVGEIRAAGAANPVPVLLTGSSSGAPWWWKLLHPPLLRT